MLSPSRSVRSSANDHPVVISLDDSDEDVGHHVPASFNRLATVLDGRTLPRRVLATPTSSQRASLTFGIPDEARWDTFPTNVDPVQRPNPFSPTHNDALSRLTDERGTPRRQSTVPTTMLARDGNITPLRQTQTYEIGSRSTTPNSPSPSSSTLDWGALSINQGSPPPPTMGDENAPQNRREPPAWLAQNQRDVVDLSRLDDETLAEYLAENPLDLPPPATTNLPGNPNPKRSELSYDIYVMHVLEVFPDVSLHHLRMLWDERVPASGSPDQPLFHQEQIGQAVILLLAEKSDYPKEKPKSLTTKRKRSSMSDSSDDEKPGWKTKRMALKHDIDYIRETTITLLNEFLLVPSDHIKGICKTNTFMYETLLALAQAEKKEAKERGYEQLKQARRLKVSPHVPPKEVVETLQAEFAAARKAISKREARRKKVQEDRDAEVAEEVRAKEAGDTFECQCCFADTPSPKTVHCNGEEPHFFCHDCALSYAKAQTDKGQYKLECFATTECKADFSHSHKLRFLNPEMLRLLDKLEQNEIMRLAGIEGLAQCPFCDYAEIYPDISENKIFRCQALTCMKASCRLCNLDSHVPQTCAEFKAENGVSERHVLEEAMTKALIRNCPQCETPILKESGCNKMICTKCRCAICDYCGKDITRAGYGHFEGPAGARTGGCPTNDDTFVRNDTRVKAAEKEAMDKIRAENPKLSEEDLKIKFSEKVSTVNPTEGRPAYDPMHRAILDELPVLDPNYRQLVFPPGNPMLRPVNPVDRALLRAGMNANVPPLPALQPYARPDHNAMPADPRARRDAFLEAGRAFGGAPQDPYAALRYAAGRGRDYNPPLDLQLDGPHRENLLARRREEEGRAEVPEGGRPGLEPLTRLDMEAMARAHELLRQRFGRPFRGDLEAMRARVRRVQEQAHRMETGAHDDAPVEEGVARAPTVPASPWEEADALPDALLGMENEGAAVQIWPPFRDTVGAPPSRMRFDAGRLRPENPMQPPAERRLRPVGGLRPGEGTQPADHAEPGVDLRRAMGGRMRRTRAMFREEEEELRRRGGGGGT